MSVRRDECEKSDFASASIESGRNVDGKFSLVSGHRGLDALMPNVQRFIPRVTPS